MNKPTQPKRPSTQLTKTATAKVTAKPPAESNTQLTKTATAMVTAEPPAESCLRIVGIGSSAGGLEALELFLNAVPPASGLAFVIIQHMDPTHKGMMPELLQRTTEIKVMEAEDRTTVRPNCAYVIPPNKDMSILHGVLHLLEPTKTRGLRLPIDFFFRSLAQDQMSKSVGIILSGMGSDGCLGLRSIKEQIGLVLVQDPTTAKFDGMPRSAIDAGLADVVAPVDELPRKLIACLHRRSPTSPQQESMPDSELSALEKTIILLRAQTGHDFSLYKQNTLFRRIERRMSIHQIGNIATYVRYLQENDQEITLLFKELLIGVTNFFRDKPVWELLRTKTIPALIKRSPTQRVLRAWVAGCSSGEEAYSLAIVFKEALEHAKIFNVTLQIFATDLDQDAIDKARLGFFPSNIAADVSATRLKRFFSEMKDGYRIRKEIRQMVIFAQQNLTMDAPFTKLDLLCCRNLLIYLSPKVQQQLIPVFHYSLNPDGILLLGNSETIGNYNNLFTSLNSSARLYQRSDADHSALLVHFPLSFNPTPMLEDAHRTLAMPPSLEDLANHLILKEFAPPAALVNGQGDILFVSGHTGRYLEPAAGKADWNLFVMARAGLRYELAAAFHKAVRQKESITIKNIKIEPGENEHFADIFVEQLDQPPLLKDLVMVVFHELPAPIVDPSKKQRTRRGKDAHDTSLASLEDELRRISAESQISNEAMQTLKQEYRSANEELQSTNEELQSANEELTTSKEEMQSLNEELHTLNAELQSKLDELSRASNDMRNLLNSTDIAILFLDKTLNIRRFTPQTTHIIKLIQSDIGRPITDLVSTLKFPELINDVREVIRTLISQEKQLRSSDKTWFNMRIIPYRTVDDKIDGVVITFSDITTAKNLEARLRKEGEANT